MSERVERNEMATERIYKNEKSRWIEGKKGRHTHHMGQIEKANSKKSIKKGTDLGDNGI